MKILTQNSTSEISTRRSRRIVICALALGCFLAIPVTAQEPAQDRAASLRARLADVQAKQDELQNRQQQLQEELKPENIERSLAGVGSTHPEQLRDQRRRQLEIEMNGVKAQLDSVAASRIRLEESIARADAESYWQSAGVVPSASRPEQGNAATVSGSTSQSKKHSTRRRKVSAGNAADQP
jgi:septal ring factor EnvC (AmiA/AmiB activator)